MVSIKKIFGSSESGSHDPADLRTADTTTKSSGKETEARHKNDELASRLHSGSDNHDSTDSSADRRKSLTGNSNTGLNTNNNTNSSPRQSSSTTGYNTEGTTSHADNRNAHGEYNKGLDNIGSHRGLVGSNQDSARSGHLNESSRPIVEVVNRETVPQAKNSALDHIEHTHTTHARDNSPSQQSSLPQQSHSTPVAAVNTEKTGHGRLSSASSGHGFTNPHETGHSASRLQQEFDPKLATHDHQHLQHVTHREVRHVEVEEVERQTEIDRHVHHVQTHIQPVLDKKVMPERIRENVIAPTKINEVHASTAEDVALFEQLSTQHQNTETHRAKERTVVDLGEKVHENVIHHVHHVTQPVIEQEVVERHRIHTVIPVHHVTHEAPIIHKSSTHAPVSINDFLQGGGKLDSHVTAETAGLLADKDCERTVDGDAERIMERLHLGSSKSNFGSYSTGAPRTSRRPGRKVGRSGSMSSVSSSDEENGSRQQKREKKGLMQKAKEAVGAGNKQQTGQTYSTGNNQSVNQNY